MKCFLLSFHHLMCVCSVSACRMLAISIALLLPPYSFQTAENTVLSLGSRGQHQDAHFQEFLRSVHPLHPILGLGKTREPSSPRSSSQTPSPPVPQSFGAIFTLSSTRMLLISSAQL